MLKLSRKKRRQSSVVESPVIAMVRQVHAHPAWKGELGLTEIQSLLEGHPSYTIVLSQGMDKLHFFLSFVDADQLVRHKNVRILRIHGSWIFKNGSGITFNEISDLIPHCLKCSHEICQPLS